MPFRTVTASLLDSCANNKTCKSCKYRIGCFIRYSFYVHNTEASFDEFLKMHVESDSKLSAEVCDNLREKYKDERKRYPEYSPV